jgi:hypothetical protein
MANGRLRHRKDDPTRERREHPVRPVEKGAIPLWVATKISWFKCSDESHPADTEWIEETRIEKGGEYWRGRDGGVNTTGKSNR